MTKFDVIRFDEPRRIHADIIGAHMQGDVKQRKWFSYHSEIEQST